MFGAWIGFTDAQLAADRASAKARADKLVAECREIHAEPVMVRSLHPGDCASCGSQEFRHWKGVSVCSYCRSTAQTPRHTPSDTGLSAFGRNLTASRYAEYMHALARITTD